MKEADVGNKIVRVSAALTTTGRARDSQNAEIIESRSSTSSMEAALHKAERECKYFQKRADELSAGTGEVEREFASGAADNDASLAKARKNLVSANFNAAAKS